MVLGMSVDTFFDLVGHNGSRIVDSKLEDPLGRAGIHVQEAIEVCLRWNYRVTPIELFPTSINHRRATEPRVIHFTAEDNWDRFKRHLYESRGVIYCETPRCGHAVAYDRGIIYDPAGSEFSYTVLACESRNLFTRMLWRVDRG